MKLPLRQFVLAAAAAVVFSASTAPAQDASKATPNPAGKPTDVAKPVRVFILAGQSNTVGHSNGHTMCTLFHADGPKDRALAELVFGRDTKLSPERFEEMLALGKQLDELTGGVGDPKIAAMTDAASKAAAEAEAARIKAILDGYQKEVVAASAVSDRVCIASIADNNRKSGKLGVGYGASEAKIGPEYGFGLSIARKIDGPILLIKASWGGKSLNYDFRPPSRPDFQTTPEYAEAKAQAEAEQKRYEAAVKSFPQDQQKYQADLAAYEEQMKTADENARKKLTKPKPPAQPRQPRPFAMDDAGLNYRLLNEAVRKVLDNLPEHHPAYDPAAGYELAGFVWFQGFNDQFNDHFKANYKDNMVAFIKDIRREYEAPQLPFVIGVLGTGQTKEQVDANAVSVAQRAAAALPEFRGNVLAVESYPEYALDALAVYNAGWQKNFYAWSLVGSDRPYHYLGSGKFFVRLGDAFASAMAGMLPQPAVQEALGAVRDNRAGVYDAYQSNTLGTTASPAEYAATQRNLRRHYLTPSEPLDLSAARQDELSSLYGRVALVGAPRCVKAFALGITGASVIDVDQRPELIVTGVEPGSPAEGKLEVGDVIIGSNDRLVPEWEDPRVPIGYAVAAAQTKEFGGRLTLHVGRGGKVISVEIQLPVDGGYGDDWPADCARSRAIAAAAVNYVMHNGDDTFWKHLFLMGCGDWNEMAVVRDELRKSQATGSIASNWGSSYRLVSLCEYYLLTHDRQVLPAIECHVRGLEANQMLTGGWSHGAPGGYGMMNQVGQVCFIGLVLARECGVEVDPTVLARATTLSGRFIGTYGHYGDHAPEDGKYLKAAPNDNGKVQAHAVLFDLLGEPAAGRRSARRACYLYRTALGGHAERIFAIAWSGVGAHLAPQPEFRMYADNMLWYYELARRRSGGLTDLGHTRYQKSTAAVGMIFTLPGKRLRIAGGPRRTEPLFPIDKLEGIPVASREPIAEWQPVQPAAPAGQEDSTTTWDSLLAIESATCGVADADAFDPQAATRWYARESAADGWVTATGSLTLGKSPAGTLLRTTFECREPTYTRLRLTLPSAVAGELFLNGARIVVFPAGARGSRPTRTLDLGERATGALVRGENVLAAKLTGPPGGAIAINLAAGPGMIDKRSIAASPGIFGDYRRDGWVGTPAQHRQSVDWFFADKSPEEIARYLPYPDWNGAQTAYQALAARGPAALSLLERLVEDSHEGIRAGGWDAIGEMHARGQLPEEAAGRFIRLAVKRAALETGPAGAAILRTVGPLAKGESLAMILAALATVPDFTVRKTVAEIAERDLKDRPDLLVTVTKAVVEGGIAFCDIRTVGNALGTISSHATLPEARASVPAIARVLNDEAPETRGMFSNGLMQGGLDVIDRQFDEQLEQTPLLVSGLCRCFVRVPDMDHPAWTYPNLYLRRLLYRLSAASAERIEATLNEIAASPDAGQNDSQRRAAPMAELRAWAALLRRTGGEPNALRSEASRLAASDDPSERLVALSLVWPSDRSSLPKPRNRAFQYADTARVTEPADRLAVVASASRHFAGNTPMHWLLIWETAKCYSDCEESRPVLASLGEFFDTVAYRQRGTFSFRAIDAAMELAKAQLASTGATDAHALARGLCKTYATSANMVWYTATRDQLQKVVTPLAASSPKAAAEAVTAIEAWLKEAPAEERRAVLAHQYKLTATDVTKRLAELRNQKP